MSNFHLQVMKFASQAACASHEKQASKHKKAEDLVVAAKQEQEQETAADKRSAAQRKVDELEGAVKGELHKLNQIQTNMAALEALGASGPCASSSVHSWVLLLYTHCRHPWHACCLPVNIGR